MDEMALLCNLHADGPATLKVLRRAGIRSLSEVCGYDTRKLADTLGVSPAFARRFAREARFLAGRMGAAVLEVEEGDTVSAPAAVEERADPSPAQAPVDGRAYVDGMVRVDSPARGARAHTPNVHAPGMAAQAREPARNEHTAPVEQRAERASIVASTGTRLAHGLIAGLEREYCDRLVAQGIRTLEELAAAPGLALARRVSMPLPRLLDLQYLAQRRLAEPVSEESSSPTTGDIDEPQYVLHPPPRAASPWTPPAAKEREPMPWRADIGHLQPPLRTPIQPDSEVAGPFA